MVYTLSPVRAHKKSVSFKLTLYSYPFYSHLNVIQHFSKKYLNFNTDFAYFVYYFVDPGTTFLGKFGPNHIHIPKNNPIP